MVLADTLSAEALIHSMEAGSFYSTMGVTLSELSFDDSAIHIEILPEKGVDYTISLIGYRKGNSFTEELESVKGASARFKLDNDILFARCKITSTKRHGNPVESLYYEMAWTQPVIPE